MRQVREILRLTFSSEIGGREIARRLGIAASTVRATVERFRSAGLTWPLADEMTDAVLEDKLYGNAGTKQGHRRHAEPDWARIHRELKRKHVTLSILWEEYIEQHADGYRYSRFCELYRSWEVRLSVTMRQSHAGGDKLFVDYAGDGVPVVIDRFTGETRHAQMLPSWAPRTSLMRRRPGRRGSPTGSALIRIRSRRSAGFPISSFLITPKSRSSRHVCMILK